jgi:hypothetical protein
MSIGPAKLITDSPYRNPRTASFEDVRDLLRNAL